ncbi:inositol polyphosphate 5-phosphatase [Trichinella spiralis]|uniref:inositol polyphosphate 5-phosphatase n=1 Tax=Trichinella spiralis TaxID=6334 RepID=UPI0001EFD082|nr:inositol polyphosphate 5-phosphatase [Trichinella spiralis]
MTRCLHVHQKVVPLHNSSAGFNRFYNAMTAPSKPLVLTRPSKLVLHNRLNLLCSADIQTSTNFPFQTNKRPQFHCGKLIEDYYLNNTFSSSLHNVTL